MASVYALCGEIEGRKARKKKGREGRSEGEKKEGGRGEEKKEGKVIHLYGYRMYLTNIYWCVF